MLKGWRLQNPSGKITLVKKTDGYRLLNAETIGSPSILTLPVTFDKHWVATWHGTSSSFILKTFLSNSAFLGILIPEGSGTIEVLYDDKPKIINHMLSGLGIFILLLVFLYFKKVSPLKQS